MNRKQFLKSLAEQYGWAIADLERALAGQPLDQLEQSEILDLMLRFAGQELQARQRLQAAQKAQVTKKAKALDASEQRLIQTAQEYESRVEEERSHWYRVVTKLYQMAQRLGLKSDWIEELLERRL
jgi:hypothetical protein